MLLLLLFMFTWARSATRLIYALAREGMFPRAVARVDAGTAAPRRAALALGGAWGLALAVQVVLGVPIETYIQLASGNFLLTYVLIMLTAWRLLQVRRFLPALLSSSLAILLLVFAGLPRLWYAVVPPAVFAAPLAALRAAPKNFLQHHSTRERFPGH